jgi:uncharacterized protein YggT (Ycf19 family)
MVDGFWTFQVPNLLIAMAMYSVLARFVLSLFMTDDQVLMRVFNQITNPVLVPVLALTPIIVPERVVYLFAFVWLFALRVVLYVVMRMYGLAPSIAG